MNLMQKLLAAWTFRKPGETGELPATISSVRFASDLRVSADESGITILQTEKGRMFRSNRIGADIWKQLSDQKHPGAIAAELSAQYDVPVAEIELHVTAFLRQLRKDGMITVR